MQNNKQLAPNYRFLDADGEALRRELNEIKSRITFLETKAVEFGNDIYEINNELNELKTKVNNLENVQIVKWTRHDDIAHNLELYETDFELYFDFDTNYLYSNLYILDIKIVEQDQTAGHFIHRNFDDYGLAFDIVPSNTTQSLANARLKIKYDHTKNKNIDYGKLYAVNVLYMQYRYF